MEKYIDEFMNRLGAPSSYEKLIEYISFCLDKKCAKSDKTESHHLFPRNKFPEHKSNKMYQVDLLYLDHCTAHLLLAEAYPIKEFTRTLNFMQFDEIHNDRKREAVSIAAKAQWVKIKNDPVAFARFKSKRSLFMKEYLAKDTEANKLFCEIMKEYYKTDEGTKTKEKIGIGSRESWASLTEEEYIKRTDSMKWKDSPDYEKRVAAASIRYEDEEFMKIFIETMTIVNKDPEKRKLAGDSIKKLWETEEYRENVMLSRKATNDKLKEDGIKRSNSTKIKEKWQDPVWKAAILADRKAKRDLLIPEKERIKQEKKEIKRLEKERIKQENQILGNKTGNSDKLKEKWQDPIWVEKMTLARIEARRKKLNETN